MLMFGRLVFKSEALLLLHSGASNGVIGKPIDLTTVATMKNSIWNQQNVVLPTNVC